MLPAKTNHSTITLVMAGGGDLPAEIIVSDEADQDPVVGLESVWVLDDGERKAIANGAPVHLVVWVGTIDPSLDHHGRAVQLQRMLEQNTLTQPPVSLNAGAPPSGGHELISREHLDRALGYVFAAIQENGTTNIIPAPVRDAVDRLQQATATFGTGALTGTKSAPKSALQDLLDAIASLGDAVDAPRIQHPADYIIRHRNRAGAETAEVLQPDGFIKLWDEALAATRDVPGDGGSIDDIALPSDTRRELG